MRRFCYLLLAMTGSMLGGCGGQSDAPQMATVEGSVTWKGKPLAEAGVAFTPVAGPVSVGVTDNAGRFSLSTQGRPGATIGSHRVTIEAFEPIPPGKLAVAPNGERLFTPVSRISRKYGELTNSGLEANVTPKASENKFEFTLQ